jgi:hypothetical protein
MPIASVMVIARRLRMARPSRESSMFCVVTMAASNVAQIM